MSKYLRKEKDIEDSSSCSIAPPEVPNDRWAQAETTNLDWHGEKEGQESSEHNVEES